MERRSQNSLVLQQLQELASNFILDLQTHHPSHRKNLSFDLRTLKRRSEAEGVSFFTSTLPLLGKALLRSLETKEFSCPTGFKRIRGTAIPRLFGGLLKEVIDLNGRILYDLDIPVLTDVLQFCFMFYKLELPADPRKDRRVIQAFIKTEEELKTLEIPNDSIVQDASRLVERVLRGFDPMEITPRHGPGAVATRERQSDKWNFKRKYESIHKVYPYYTYFTPSRASLLRNISDYKRLETLESGTARVVLVPKDSRGPRLISMEPLEYQFIQQGIARSLVKQIEKVSPLTRGSVNFTDQSINRRLALENSLSRESSTLDMKEASDRVSLQLVQKVFERRPDVLRALEATRTTSTELPCGTILPLRKFAPMGSALCFPVEALVFWALAETLRRKARIRGRVFVYGDDIIVPRKLTPILFKLFPRYGLKFNEDKCFTRGHFRESCGMDAYRGNRCTPVRMRKSMPKSRKEVSSLVSSVEFSNHLWEKGYWYSATYVQNVCQKILHVGVLRSPKVNFGGLSYVSFTTKGVIIDDSLRTRFNSNLQRTEVYVPLTREVLKKTKIKSDKRLFANLVGQFIEKYTVPHTASLKLRWMPILAWVA